MNDQSSASSQEQKANKTWILMSFVVVFFLLLGSFVGLYLYNKQHKITVTQLTPPPTVTSSSIPTAVPSATPIPASPSAAQIRVLNGSGTVGIAQPIANALRKAGFTQLTLGNASTFNYQGITIQVTSDGSKYLPLIREAITEDDPTATISASVVETITGDAVVIVGR